MGLEYGRQTSDDIFIRHIRGSAERLKLILAGSDKKCKPGLL